MHFEDKPDIPTYPHVQRGSQAQIRASWGYFVFL